MRIFGFILLIIFGSCNSSPNNNYETIGQFTVASAIQLDYGKTTIHLKDYIDDITNIEFLPNEDLVLGKDLGKETLSISAKATMPLISILKVKSKEEIINLVIKKSKKLKHTISIADANHQFKTVGVKGEFNAWNTANTPMTYQNGLWSCDLFVEPDNYAYQFVVDGVETLDPTNTVKVSNGTGGWNSQLIIGDKNKLLPTIKTSSNDGRRILVNRNNESDSVVALWNNQQLDVLSQNNKIEIVIPTIATQYKRSNIRVWSYNNGGISQELYIPLKNGILVTKGAQLDRSDKETNIMYYTMIDRFSDADTTNNSPLNDPEVNPKADFHGGDLKGIKNKIENGYFDNLGITALWLSPIVQNPEGKFGFFDKKGVKSKFSSYHGYWPISFTKVDHRYGTSQDLKDIISVAHKNDMNVYLDFVANHVHEQHPVYQKHKDWATNLHLPDGTLNTEKWDEHRLTTWFDVFLPTLNLEKQEVAEMLSDSAMFWVEEYNIDGFRHDATKHIPLNFWRTLTSKTKQYTKETGKPLYQVGETYGTPSLINSYINSGMLDGQFDFNVYDVLLSSICKEEVGFDQFKERINQSIKYYGTHNLMGYMTGNQDKPRFISMATGDVSFDEDSKYAGWSRSINKKTTEGYQKLAMMHTFILTMPGIPVVYYGDEIGLAGGNDPDNRRDMKFDSLNESELTLRTKVGKLAKMRRDNPLFLFGDMEFVEVSNDRIVYTRNYFGQSAMVIINNSDEVMSYNVGDEYTGAKVVFDREIKANQIDIEPRGFEILIR